MDRLISLFREAHNGTAVLVGAERKPEYSGQPLYFVQLMEYLRHRREDGVIPDADAAAEAPELQAGQLIPEQVAG